MNPSQPSPRPDVDEQAALWAARLDGSSLTASEHAELAEWLAAGGERQGLLSGYREFSSDLGHLLPALAAAGGVGKPRGEGAPAL
ncbi:MAG TPA: FecR/PupR family sigma factor regulator, partial [Opitutaceae bacterium]|nr:FecR/PupR family sigma factor regulator [Opitutaceae bacterium]